MREIVFRAKPCYNGGKVTPWVFGEFKYLWQNIVGHHATDNGRHEKRHDKGIIIGEYGETEVLCDTLGQFTNLYDKNHNRIFEGDILRVGEEKTLIEVRFVRGVFAFLWNGDLDDEFPCNAPTQEWAEVIGNIHDNPTMIRKH